ncbi:MAG: condensation domain-containing protein, partial [Candidatus Thiodiazotropha sp.]
MVVTAGEDDRGDKRLVAYYTNKEEASTAIDAGYLRSCLSDSLPDYMVPSAFVALDAIPLTPNGKTDRKALPAPEGDAYALRAYAPPEGEIEQTLARIWCELLGVEQVGRYDHFFEMGGHSLMAVQLISQLHGKGLHADIRMLFTRPTLMDLADAIDKESPVQVPANLIPLECDRITPDLLPLITLEQNHIDRIVAATPDGAANIQDIYPLAPLQEGLLFHHLMEPQSDAYILPLLLAFDGYDRLARMLWGLQKVIDRHDILRTAILWENLPEPVQVVWRKAPLAVETVTLTPEDGDAAEQLRSRIAPGHFRLDIGRAPMMQALIAQDTVHDHWLMALPVHHLIMDHTTLELLIEEVQAHLAEDTTGLPPALPFRNFVAHARLGVSKQEHEEFFRQLLGDVEEPTAPFGLLNVRGDGSDIDEARLAVDSQLAHRLKAQVQALGVSAASVFHLAWARVLSLLCGRADVVFGTVLFGRMQGGEDADRVLGMFINTLPVRMDISEKPVAQAVHKTHQQLADLLYHEHASLALAQRCSGVLAPAPLFSSLLNYRYSRAQVPDTSAALEGIDVLYGQERTNYPLTLSVDDLEDNFFLTCQIQRSIDPMRICEYLHTTLTHLVEA